MTIDFSSTPNDSLANTESEGSMFAPVPAWERGKKRRMFGGRARSTDSTRVAEEPRSFAAETQADTLAGDQPAYAFDPIGATDDDAVATATEPAFAGTPSYASVTARRKTSVAPVAITAGVVLIGGLAATGWYMTQNHTTGMAELTPGSTATTMTTAMAGNQAPTADAAPQALPAASASASAAPAAPVTHTATTTTTHSSAPATASHRTAVAHARAPASRSASDAGSNASATLPATPQPYQPSSSAAAPTPPAATPAPPPVLNIPPTTTQAAPVETAPAPTQTAPPPSTATPPSQPPSQ
jgi:hypothetical protein